MSEPFLGELRLMSNNFPPKDWARCDGQFLPINQNQALFSLLGTTYGGNGQTTFRLPNLMGRVPIHHSDHHPLGESGGEVAHTLTLAEIPTHTHALRGVSSDADRATPSGAMLAAAPDAYADGANPVALKPTQNIGGSQPHLNMQPYLTLTWCIALKGIFPSQN